MSQSLDQLGLSLPQFRMVNRNGPPEAMNCPFFLCTVCQEPVYSVPSPDHELDGYVLWWSRFSEHDDRESQLGPFVVHRLNCMQRLEGFVDDNMGDQGYGHSLSEELGEVVRQLAHNTEHPLGTGAGDPEYPHEAEYIAPHPSTWRSGTYRGRRSDG